MKLLLITVLIGAALAKPTVQPPRESEENSSEEIQIPRADAEFAKSVPLLQRAAPTRPTSSSVEEEDLQKKPVDKTQTKPKVKSAAQTYTVPSAVPTKVAFSAPAIKAVRFTPQFTTSDEDQHDDVVAPTTAPAEGSVPQQPASTQPIGGVSTDPTVEALPAEETATESAQPIAGKYSAGPTVDAVDPVDKTEIVEPNFTTYSKNFAVLHNYAVAPSVYSVAGGLPAVPTVEALPAEETTTESAQPIASVHSTVSTVDALPVEETTTESAQPIARVHSTVPTVDALPAEETTTKSAQPIAGVYSDDSTEDAVDPVDKTEVVEPQFTTYSNNFDVVPSYAVVPSVYSVAGILPAVSHVSTIPFSQNFVSTNQIYSRSNRVYSSPSVYSSPFIYHSQGIVPSYVYHEDD